MVAATLIAAAPAQASESCVTGQSPWTYTNGDYDVKMNRYRSEYGMNCSSVRYVVNSWLRRKVEQQSGWPKLGRPFFDGYVTWHCDKVGNGSRWQCWEYTSDTSFSFKGLVYT